MIRWIRVTLPYLEYTIGGFVLIYLFFEAMIWAELYFEPDNLFPWPIGAYWQDFGIALASLVYGTFRGAGFHPIQRADYYDWLRSIPWTSEKALPLGPLRLVPQDGVVMFALTLLVVRHDIVHWLLPTALMLVGYVFCVAYVLAVTGPRLTAYAAAYVLVPGIYLCRSPEILMTLCTVAYVLCLLGLRNSLKRFPWDENEWVSQYVQQLRGGPQGFGDNPLLKRQYTAGFLRQKEIAQVGWPYYRLLPNRDSPKQGWADSILLSVLLSWFFFIVLTTVGSLDSESIRPDNRNGLAFAMRAFSFLVVVCAAMYRFLLYFLGAGVALPPISILGRLFTLRLVVPGYDKIFVAPVLAVLTIILGPYLSSCIGVPVDYSLPCFLATALLVLFKMPPSLRSWELTGTFRSLRPNRRDKRFISPSST